MQDPHFRHPRSPEDAPIWGEVGDKLGELLDGVQELAGVTRMSASDFVQAAIDEAEKTGVELDAESLDAIAMRGFGTREEALERVRDLSEAEFFEAYPGSVSDIVLNFVAPLFDLE